MAAPAALGPGGGPLLSGWRRRRHQRRQRPSWSRLRPRWGTFWVLVALTGLVAVALRPELRLGLPAPNDQMFHLGLLRRAQVALRDGGSLLDHWDAIWSLGYPVFHHYQHLVDLLLVWMHSALGGFVTLLGLLQGAQYFCLVCFPLAVYVFLTAFRLPRRVALLGALVSLACVSKPTYGIELESYLATGWGLFSQSAGALMLALALTALRRTVIEGRRPALAILALAACFASHLLFGFIAGVTALLLPFSGVRSPAEWRLRARRLVLVFAVVFAGLAYWLVPMMLDGWAHARSAYDPVIKFDSYGARRVLAMLFQGQLFDQGRWPVLTVLLFVGVLRVLRRPRPALVFCLSGFLLWLCLFFGRPTWGRALDLLPMAKDIHLQRLICAVQFFALPLIALGLDACFGWTRRFLGRRLRLLGTGGWSTRVLSRLGALVLVVLLLAPVALDRWRYLSWNAEWIASAGRRDQDPDREAFDRSLAHLGRLVDQRPGRVYPGLRANWGGRYLVGGYNAYYLCSLAGLDSVSYLPHSWSPAGDMMLNFDQTRRAHYDLFNVRYVLSDGFVPPGPATPREVIGRHRIVSLPTSGYFELINVPMAVRGRPADAWNLELLWLRSPWVEARQHFAILKGGADAEGFPMVVDLLDRWRYRLSDPGSNEEPEVTRLFSGGGDDPLRDRLATDPTGLGPPVGAVLREHLEPDRYSARVLANHASWLLLKVSFHPNWHAVVDGRPRDVLLVAPGMPAVPLAAGTHDIVFEYRPRTWKLALFGSAWLLIGAGLVFLNLRSKRGES